jgi:hypothetical protein
MKLNYNSGVYVYMCTRIRNVHFWHQSQRVWPDWESSQSIWISPHFIIHVRALQKTKKKWEAWRWIAHAHIGNSKFQFSPVRIDTCHSISHWEIWTRQLRHNGPWPVLIRRQNNEFWPRFSTHYCNRAWVSVPKLKLMNVHKRQNFRLLGAARIQQFPHKHRIAHPRQWNTIF